MELRRDVESCLRERLLNRTETGRIFEREEDHLEWLVGSTDGAQPGFLTDPAHALGRIIPSSQGEHVHPGVDMTHEEAGQLRRIVRRTSHAEMLSRVAGHPALVMAAFSLIGPILADGGGY